MNMDINEQFEKLVSSDLTEGSKWLKYSDLLLAKIHAIEKNGAKSAEVKKLDKEIKKEMDKLGITESIELNEASEVDIDGMERKPRLSIKYWEKVFKGKPETAFDGVHGYIVLIRVSSINRQQKSETITQLAKGPDFRWIEFDDKYIKIGF
jgi:hypothetical protein